MVKEVNGIVAEDLHSDKHDCVSNNGEESTFTSNNVIVFESSIFVFASGI